MTVDIKEIDSNQLTEEELALRAARKAYPQLADEYTYPQRIPGVYRI